MWFECEFSCGLCVRVAWCVSFNIWFLEWSGEVSLCVLVVCVVCVVCVVWEFVCAHRQFLAVF